MLGAGELEGERYIPYFSVYISGSGLCHYLRSNARIFDMTVDASVLKGVTLKMGTKTTVVVLGDGGERWCGGINNGVYCGGGKRRWNLREN